MLGRGTGSPGFLPLLSKCLGSCLKSGISFPSFGFFPDLSLPLFPFPHERPPPRPLWTFLWEFYFKKYFCFFDFSTCFFPCSVIICLSARSMGHWMTGCRIATRVQDTPKAVPGALKPGDNTWKPPWGSQRSGSPLPLSLLKTHSKQEFHIDRIPSWGISTVGSPPHPNWCESWKSLENVAEWLIW